MGDSQNTYDALIQKALDGIREVQKKSHEELKQWVATQPLLPSNIPTRREGFQFITSEGYSALKTLGRTWQGNDPKRSKLLSRNAAEEMAVYAFGDLLGPADELPGNADAKSNFLRIMDERLQARTQREHFYFAARVFEQEEIQTFTVGPVTFYRRFDWLDAVEKVAGSACAWKAEVLEKWTRCPSRWDQIRSWIARNVLRRRPNRSYADDVVKAIGGCEWVLAVVVEGRERSRSAECASVVALVALDGLGLPLHGKVARNLRGPGHDAEARWQERHELSQYEGQTINHSISLDYPRIGGPPGMQVALLSDASTLREAVGRALTAFVNVAPTGNAPVLMQRWVEAMYWFGQSRHEHNEFIALVKLGIALDVLAKGGKAKGILALSCAALGKSEGDVVTSDNRTLKGLVEKLYNDGRSKIAHGGSLALLQELPLELHLADRLTSLVLAGYVVCAAKYQGADTYEDFLSALPTIRSNI